MAKRKPKHEPAPPAFQFYANDWLSSRKIAVMTPAQEGAYIRLLAYAWADPTCSIPNDDQQLAVLSRLGEGWFNGGSTVVRNCFLEDPRDGTRLVNKKLLEVRKKLLEWRKKSSDAGRKSGITRRLKAQKTNEPNANQPSTKVPTKPRTKSNSSSSSSYIKQINKQTGEGENHDAPIEPQANAALLEKARVLYEEIDPSNYRWIALQAVLAVESDLLTGEALCELVEQCRGGANFADALKHLLGSWWMPLNELKRAVQARGIPWKEKWERAVKPKDYQRRNGA